MGPQVDVKTGLLSDGRGKKGGKAIVQGSVGP